MLKKSTNCLSLVKGELEGQFFLTIGYIDASDDGIISWKRYGSNDGTDTTGFFIAYGNISPKPYVKLANRNNNISIGILETRISGTVCFMKCRSHNSASNTSDYFYMHFKDPDKEIHTYKCINNKGNNNYFAWEEYINIESGITGYFGTFNEFDKDSTIPIYLGPSSTPPDWL